METFLTINVLVSIKSHFHPLLSYGNFPWWLPLSISLKVRIWVIGQARGFCSWAPLSSALLIEANLLCSCLCLFDAIVELHAMLEVVHDFLITKWTWILHVIKAYLKGIVKTTTPFVNATTLVVCSHIIWDFTRDVGVS